MINNNNKKQQHTTINSTYAAGMFMLVNKNGYFFWGGGELLLELTVNLWFVSWWGFCCSFNLFFYFEKLHRHTLKTLFNREKHINVLPFFGWIEGKKMVNGVLRSFLPSFPCGFTLFQSPTCFPLKIAWLNNQAEQSYFSILVVSSFLMSSLVIVVLHPRRCRRHSFFLFVFFFFLVIILFHHQFFPFVGTVRCRKKVFFGFDLSINRKSLKCPFFFFFKF